MNEPKKHHIVPKTYLGLFTNARDKLYKIKVNDIPRQKDGIYRITPLKEWTVSQVCYKENMYKLSESGAIFRVGLEIDDDNFVEKNCFQWYENNLESIITQIRKRQSYLTPTDAATLIGGLIHIKVRNNYFREHFPKGELLKSITSDYIEFINSDAVSQDDDSKRKAIEIFQKMKSKWDEDPNLINDLQNISLINRHLQGDSTLEKISNLLMKKKWYILETTINNLFITSDNPGYCTDSFDYVHNTMFSDGFRFFFPLNPYFGIMILDENEDNISSIKSLIFRNADSDLVDKINYLTCVLTNKDIYGNSEKAIRKSWITYYERKSFLINN